MTDRSASDEQLMAAVRSGTVDLLGVLFERHAPLLRAFFARRGLNADATEDLVQEVFLRVLRHRAGWRAEGPFAAWLWRLARNVLFDERRRVARAAIGDEERTSRDADPAAPSGAETGGSLDPDAVIVLHSALARLPQDELALIEWRWFEGCDGEALARRLGCSPGAARVRLHRAMVRLRALHGAARREES